MIANELTEQAEKASQRYQAVITGFRGAYERVFDGAYPLSAPSRTRFEADLYGIARTYLATERELIDAELAFVRDQGVREACEALGVRQTTPTEDDALSAYESDMGDHLYQEIAIQLERDIAAMVQHLRSFALQADILARANGWTKTAAITHLRLSEAGAIRLYFSDRAGRRWPSQKFVRTTWRSHLLTTYNEAYIHTLAAHGQTEARVYHPDPKNRFAGMIFGFAGQDDLPSYQEIRDDVFHPNSEAWIIPVTVSQS